MAELLFTSFNMVFLKPFTKGIVCVFYDEKSKQLSGEVISPGGQQAGDQTSLLQAIS